MLGAQFISAFLLRVQICFRVKLISLSELFLA